jgi:uncharacterized membrane protein
MQLAFLLVVAAYAHNPFHEFGHWLVGTLLGNQMSMNFNGTWITGGGSYHEAWHSPAVGIGGPAFSILMASIALIVIEKHRTIYAFPFLITPFVSRLFSLTLGKFAAQDEAGVSTSLGLGKYTVAVIVCSVLLALVWRGSIKLQLSVVAVTVWGLCCVVCKFMVIGTIKLFL